jgi:hypothetical protein
MTTDYGEEVYWSRENIWRVSMGAAAPDRKWKDRASSVGRNGQAGTTIGAPFSCWTTGRGYNSTRRARSMDKETLGDSLIGKKVTVSSIKLGEVIEGELLVWTDMGLVVKDSEQHHGHHRYFLPWYTVAFVDIGQDE